jgi:hypothetical protein
MKQHKIDVFKICRGESVISSVHDNCDWHPMLFKNIYYEACDNSMSQPYNNLNLIAVSMLSRLKAAFVQYRDVVTILQVCNAT